MLNLDYTEGTEVDKFLPHPSHSPERSSWKMRFLVKTKCPRAAFGLEKVLSKYFLNEQYTEKCQRFMGTHSQSTLPIIFKEICVCTCSL